MKIEELLFRISDICRRKHFSYATEKAYKGWVQSYSREVVAMPAEWTSEEKVAGFLTQIARKGVAAATQSQALNALVFLYGQVLGTPLGNVDALRVRRPATVRIALSLEETRALLAHIEDVGGYPTRLVVQLLYGCGLRVTEPLELRIKDVDVEGDDHGAVGEGKQGSGGESADLFERRDGGPTAMGGLVAAGDVEAGLPVALPGLLATKTPRARFDRGWAWVFPTAKPIAHPRTGEMVRWRMHEVNVQRAVRRAADKAGLSVKVTPHVLRHTFATHAHQAGAAARDLQAVLGHTSLETTMGYLEAETRRVRSPLDALQFPEGGPEA